LDDPPIGGGIKSYRAEPYRSKTAIFFMVNHQAIDIPVLIQSPFFSAALDQKSCSVPFFGWAMGLHITVDAQIEWMP
jgi:hypothetical protein